MQAIERIRAALKHLKDVPSSLKTGLGIDEYRAACRPVSMSEVLAHIDKMEAENNNLCTVMMAAAVEIQEHWDAHCDADGYGPANLMRRLENGYPEQYGYNAETVVQLEAENERLRKDAERYRWLAKYLVSDDESHNDAIVAATTVAELDYVIDAAMDGTP